MPSAAALVSSCRKSRSSGVPKNVLCQTVQVRGTPSAKSSITGDPMANTSCLFIHWWWPCTCRKSPAEVKKFIVSQVERKLQFGLVRLRINPRRCEAWCELDEVTREKLSNTWQRSDRTSVGRFCHRHEVKPNRKFDSVRGLVDRNFRTVRKGFSIQFSISSPVIVRNRRIEPKFGLLNLSNTSVVFPASGLGDQPVQFCLFSQKRNLFGDVFANIVENMLSTCGLGFYARFLFAIETSNSGTIVYIGAHVWEFYLWLLWLVSRVHLLLCRYGRRNVFPWLSQGNDFQCIHVSKLMNTVTAQVYGSS